MQQFKTRNETNIRKSIARTDKTEREERIKQGLLTPPPKQTKQARTPKQQMIINKLGDMVAKSQEKQKESKYMSVLQDAEPLIFKREMKKATKIVCMIFKTFRFYSYENIQKHNLKSFKI